MQKKSGVLTLLALVPLFSGLTSCGFSPSSNETNASILSIGGGLSDENLWDHFVTTVNDPSYNGYVKFSLVLNAAGEIEEFILHPSSFRYHADHLRTLPRFRGMTPAQIDRIAMYTKDRKLLLGTMLFPKDENTYLASPWKVDVQLLGYDPLDVSLVKAAFDALAKAHGNRLAKVSYSPVAEQRLYVNGHKSEFAAAGIALAQPTSKNAICYNAAWTVGRVRVMTAADVPAAMRAGQISPDDVLVLDEAPRELPIVAGVVVGNESSPSSHPALLAKMLSIPFIFEKDAHNLDKWKGLSAENSFIFLHAMGEPGAGCRILVRSAGAVTATEASNLLALKRPIPLKIPPYDDTVSSMLDLAKLSHADSAKVGSKAANVAELMKVIPRNTVDSGLAVPISFFARYLREGKTASGESLQSVVAPHLKRLTENNLPLSEIMIELETIKTAIIDGVIPDPLAAKILTAVQSKFPQGTKVKLRSSSNVEDNQDFNGAGLYESFGACSGDDARGPAETSLCNARKKPDPVLNATKKVWASLYTTKAFVARRYFGIDESKVGMGILVQKSFKDELANGVAISQKAQYGEEQDLEIHSTGFPGEDDAVTNPPPGKTPETVVINPNEVQLIVPSTEVPAGRMLLDDVHYRSLFDLLSSLHSHYRRLLNPIDLRQFKLDFEWKLIPEGDKKKIIVKQVRPVPSTERSDGTKGRGTFLVGERNRLWCPVARENSDALQKLKFAFPIRLSIATHEIPLSAASAIANPVENGAAMLSQFNGFEPIKLVSQTSQVTIDPWRTSYDNSSEFRAYTVSSPVTLGGGRNVTIGWGGTQYRSLHQSDLPIDPVSSIAAGSIMISESETSYGEFIAVEGTDVCEEDAYQNRQLGTVGAYTVEPPGSTKTFAETFVSTTGSGPQFEISGRSLLMTSGRVIDKTMFRQVDRMIIRGLLARNLVISEPHKAVYSPGHHNFWWEYGVDVMAAENLSSTEKKELAKKGIRYLVFPAKGSTSNNGEYDVAAVDESGTQTIVGRVKLNRGE